MTTDRLCLFGAPTLESGGRSIALPFERRSQLLVLLALRRSWVGRAELAATLWPDQPARLAHANLRKTLFRLPRLAGAPALESQAGALRVRLDTDVAAFDAGLATPGGPPVGELLALRRGELLLGFEDDANETWSGWLSFERERLRVAWRRAALEHVARDAPVAEALDLTAQLLESDPLDEAAMAAQLRALQRQGQGARARQAYRGFAERLRAELGLEPGAELRALLDARQDAPRIDAGTAAPARLSATGPPGPDDGFVGRVAERRQLGALLARDDCRLLTLLGPGGIGKTRLARRVLQDHDRRAPDGAAGPDSAPDTGPRGVFVDLAGVDTAAQAATSIARALGLARGGGTDPLAPVIEALQAHARLLVLDNLEQIGDAAAFVARLLHGCPALRIVGTSRVRLGLPAEHGFAMDGLPCPDAGDEDLVESFDAARLFVQAARRVDVAFDAEPQAGAIVEICRQVGGMPLALELAASWTRVLPCDAIALELRDGTELLRSADPTYPPRHASVELVFEQSWRLLTAAERDALARLSVFRDGFSAPSARAVADAPLPVLGALADKSLLRRDGARLHLHALVRQFAGLRLGDGAERAAAEQAHAQHFLGQLRQLRRRVDDGERDALQAVESEFENHRAAWRWAGAQARTDELAGSVATLLHFCDHRGRNEEGLSLFAEALDSAAARVDPALGARLLGAVAHLKYRLDRYADAEADASRAIVVAARARDVDTELQCRKVLAGCSLRLGRHDEARRHYRLALRLAPAGSDPHNAAAMLDNLALVEKMTGHLDEALHLSQAALLQFQRLGDVAGEALCLNNLGLLSLQRGDEATAGARYRAALELCDRHGQRSTTLAAVHSNLCELAWRQRDVDAAERHARRGVEVAEAIGHRAAACGLRLALARLAARRGDRASARRELASGAALALAIGTEALQLEAASGLADVLAADGEPALGRGLLQYVLEHPALAAPQRAEVQARLAEFAPGRVPTPADPGLPLGELVHRIVAEADVAHAPLLERLRAAR